MTGGLICLHLEDHRRMMMGVIYTVLFIFSIYVSRVIVPVFVWVTSGILPLAKNMHLEIALHARIILNCNCR